MSCNPTDLWKLGVSSFQGKPAKAGWDHQPENWACTQVFNEGFLTSAAAAAKSLQSCPTLCDPIDGSTPGSPVPGILQARTLEWVAISFSKAWKWKVKVKSLSRVWLFMTPWTVAYQAPPFMGFSRQEYWSGLPLPSPSETGKLPSGPAKCLQFWVFRSM